MLSVAFFIIMPSAIMLSVIMLSVITLSAIVLSVVMRHYAECRGAVFNAASSLGSSLIFVAKAGASLSGAHKGGQ